MLKVKAKMNVFAAPLKYLLFVQEQIAFNLLTALASDKMWAWTDVQSKSPSVLDATQSTT